MSDRPTPRRDRRLSARRVPPGRRRRPSVVLVLLAVLVAVLLLAVLAVVVAGISSTPAESYQPSYVPTVEEDDPGWDCSTMGNRACGPARTDPRS